ncbi:MAG: hypothetical protein GF384_05490, partial [Elusimicrobia bacterium]|nr:hypothetical protein [Elusimicrobiota bacterium]
VDLLTQCAGVVTTGGGILSHAAITARELEIPSVIIPNAEFIEEDDGSRVCQIVSYHPGSVSRTSHGYLVSRQVEQSIYSIKDNARILVDGIDGTILLETQADSLPPMADEEQEPEYRHEHARPASPKAVARPRRTDPLIPLNNLDRNDGLTAGPKGANLGELAHLAQKTGLFKTADGFVVTLNAFNEFIRETGIEQHIEEILHADISHESKYVQIAALFVQAMQNYQGSLKKLIEKHTKKHKKSNRWWAVRSSNIDEDSFDAAFAGLGQTSLFVHTMYIFASVIENFSSFATPRALAYREKRGLSGSLISHAVVVQEMVDAEIAGVLFSKNPVTENQNEVVINASYGLGESIVSGLCQPDQYTTNKQTGAEVQEAFIGRKQIQIIQRAIEAGTKIVSTPITARRKRALSREWVKRLTHVAREIEKHYGHPVDIEFAISKNELYILQVRPITTGTKQKAVSSDLPDASKQDPADPSSDQETGRSS